MKRKALILTALAVLGSPLAGQVPSTLTPGARVRVTSNGGNHVVGVVDSIAEGRFFLHSGRVGSAYSDTSLARLEVSAGSHRRIGRSVLVTTLISAGALGIIASATYEPCSPTRPQTTDVYGAFVWALAEGIVCSMPPNSRGEAFTWGAAAGAVVGVPLGLIIGLAWKHDRWEDVIAGAPDAPKAALRLMPTRDGGFSLAASIPLGGR